MAELAGSRVGPYTIVDSLGSGGMGEVYKARDERLGRDVAIKLLPAELAQDRERLWRFAEEARAAGALNHPNVLSIYDIGTHDEAPYLVFELIQGETLRQRLRRGQLPPRRAIQIAAQIARGLAAAHGRGIVHRDLKPENFLITADDRVKILDFGLAKLVRKLPQDAPAGSANGAVLRTTPGMVVGTVGYGAPEQVQGQEADPRSDIFALGVILYEMLSGERPFRGETMIDTLQAIVNRDPPKIAVTSEVPPGLVRVVERCLEKSPENRFQSAQDLAFHLEQLNDSTSTLQPSLTGVTSRQAGQRSSKEVWRLAAAAAAGVALALAGVAWLHRAEPRSVPVVRGLTCSGLDSSPAVAPGGETVAFISARDGRSRVWLRQVTTGEEAPLTAGQDSFPRFSPDGSSIIFVRDEALYQVSVLGGEPRLLVDDAQDADWSPDGGRVAFIRGQESWDCALLVVNADGSGEREIHHSRGRLLRAPRWSPDGRWIAAFEITAGGTARAPVLLVDPEGGEKRTIPTSATGGTPICLTWSGSGQSLVYAQPQGPTPLIWRFGILLHDLPSGKTVPLLYLPMTVNGVEIPADRRLILGTVAGWCQLRESSLEVPESSRPRWLTRGSSIDRQPVYTHDGEWVLFSSNRGESFDIWAVSSSTGMVKRLTDSPASDWDPVVTADDQNLVWSSDRGGSFEIWIAERDGRNPRQVTQDGFDAENPSVTPDGGWIVYNSTHPERLGVWKIRPDGTRDQRVVAGATGIPEVSPDGRHVLFLLTPSPAGSLLRVARLEDGALVGFEILCYARVPGLALVPGRARWLPDGKAIAFVDAESDGTTGVFVQDFVPGLDTSQTRRRLVGLATDGMVESFAISPDGGRITLAVSETMASLTEVVDVPGVEAPRRALSGVSH